MTDITPPTPPPSGDAPGLSWTPPTPSQVGHDVRWAPLHEDERAWAPGGGHGYAPYTQPLPAAYYPPQGLSPPYAKGRTSRRVLFAGLAVGLVAAIIAVLIGLQIGIRISRNRLLPGVNAPASIPAPAVPAPSAPPAAPTPTSPPGSSPPQAAGNVTRGVVDVDVTLAYGRGSAAGTGMILDPKGVILTNDHVVAGSAFVSVQIGGTGPTYPATVVGSDATDDVAVLQLKGAGDLTPVQTGDPSTLAVGDAVTAVGNALGRSGPPAVVTGVVQALDQTIPVTDPETGTEQQLRGLIQTDAPLQPGDSGGPLLDSHAQVVGMDTAATVGGRYRRTARDGFAIPIDRALEIARQIRAGQGSSTVQIGPSAVLGITLSSGSSGAVVTDVQPGSPAAGAGLSAGDRIVDFDGRSVDSVETLKSLVAPHKPGDKVALGWVDESGQHHSASVRLAAGPPR